MQAHFNPYTIIQMNDEIDGVEKLKLHLRANGLNPADFVFTKFNYLPRWLEDSFSLGYQKSALQLGKGIIITLASRDWQME